MNKEFSGALTSKVRYLVSWPDGYSQSGRIILSLFAFKSKLYGRQRGPLAFLEEIGFTIL
ncbi:hypothetical protein A7975_31105 [Bacillus sp. FJAT-26390]|nr:hypothetical protein A7975_31105 [Bacillus sp. FJAT-26390]